MKKLALLGSTGSIGTQALDVVRCIQKEGEHAVKVEALAAHSNIRLLEEQIREFKPQAVAVFDLEAASKLRAAVRDLNVKVYSGMEGLCALTELESVDIVLNSVVGMVGLKPTLTALEAKKQMALANKETLVAGGSLVMKTAKENGIEILPVDSEHSAIFQCLQGMYKKCDLNKIILTASGGPFFGKKAGELRHIRPADALKHPNWDMGAKVTIDSSTLMNKGLEFIEAKWLFDMEPDDIDVVVHRESIVHSLIEYKDHSVIAQLGVAGYAHSHPVCAYLPAPLPVACKAVEFGRLAEVDVLCAGRRNLYVLRRVQACHSPRRYIARGGQRCKRSRCCAVFKRKNRLAGHRRARVPCSRYI